MKFKVSNIDYYVPQSLLLTLVGTGTVTKRLQDVSISGNELTVTLTAAERTTLGSRNITVKLVVYSNMGTASAQMQASFADLDNGTVITEMVLQATTDQGGAAHRNLLLNPFFTINQRGQTAYFGTSGTYTVDGWVINGKTNVDVVADGIKISSPDETSGTSQQGLIQHLERVNYKHLNGKTVTVSVDVADVRNDGYMRIQLYDGTTWHSISTNPHIGINSKAVTLSDNITSLQLQIMVNASSTPHKNNYITLKRAKLEVGAISTLMYDNPPDYAEELRRCQRYYQRIKAYAGSSLIGFGFTNNAGAYAFVQIPLTVPMRTTPAVKKSGNFMINQKINGAGVVKDVTGFAIHAAYQHSVFLIANATGLTGNNPVWMQVNQDEDAYIELIAEP